MGAISPAHATVDAVTRDLHDASEPYAQVLAVVSAADPESLISAGAPTDEYVPEAAELAAILRAGHRVDAGVLVSVWGWWFGGDSILVTADPAVAEGLAADLNALRVASS